MLAAGTFDLSYDAENHLVGVAPQGGLMKMSLGEQVLESTQAPTQTGTPTETPTPIETPTEPTPTETASPPHSLRSGVKQPRLWKAHRQ